MDGGSRRGHRMKLPPIVWLCWREQGGYSIWGPATFIVRDEPGKALKTGGVPQAKGRQVRVGMGRGEGTGGAETGR